MKVKSESEREVAQSCPTLSDPMDWSLPGSSVHGIFQARVLEWGAIAFSKQAHRDAHYVIVLMFSVCVAAIFKIYPLCRVQVDTMLYMRFLESTHPVTLKYCIL